MEINGRIKKVVFVVYSLDMGGAERVVSELANHFSENNIEVYIVLAKYNVVAYDLKEKIRVIPLKKNGKKRKEPIDIGRLFKIRKIVNEINPCIVISFLTALNIYTCFALLFTKHKVIVSERTDPRRFKKNIFLRVLRLFTYSFLADGIVFQTNNAKEFFSQKIQKKATIIGNPIKKGLPDAYCGKREKRIIAIGRLVKIKNYEFMIKAFSKFHKTHKDYTLEIYGEGAEGEKLIELTKKLNISRHVLFNGNVPNLHKKIVKASLYLLTSDLEGMPNSLMEAMAIGLPSISSDCSNGSPKDLIEHGKNGMLFSAGNEKELLECMNQLLSNYNLSMIISKNAKKIENKFSLSKIGAKWILYIEKIVYSENEIEIK